MVCVGSDGQICNTGRRAPRRKTWKPCDRTSYQSSSRTVTHLHSCAMSEPPRHVQNEMLKCKLFNLWLDCRIVKVLFLFFFTKREALFKSVLITEWHKRNMQKKKEMTQLEEKEERRRGGGCHESNTSHCGVAEFSFLKDLIWNRGKSRNITCCETHWGTINFPRLSP